MDQLENVGTLTQWGVDVPLPGTERYPGTPISSKYGGPRQSQARRGASPLRPNDGPLSDGPLPAELIPRTSLATGKKPSPSAPAGPKARAERKRRPRIIDTLAQARHFQHIIDSGQVKNAAQVARDLSLTRARVSQVLSLLRLAPEILDYIDALKGDEGEMFLTAKKLLPLVRLPPAEQRSHFETITGEQQP